MNIRVYFKDGESRLYINTDLNQVINMRPYLHRLEIVDEEVIDCRKLPTTSGEHLARICLNLGVSLEDVRSKAQKGNLSLTRKVIAYVMREKGFSYPEIGDVMFRDHSSIVKAVNDCRSWRSTPDHMANDIYNMAIK